MSDADDLVTWLAKLAAASTLPPKIVTLSRSPVKNLLGHVFGAGATANPLVRPDPDVTAFSPSAFPPATQAVFARFIDPGTLARTMREHGDWLAAATAVILQCAVTGAAAAALELSGFTQSRVFTGSGPPRIVFSRPLATLAPRRDTSALAHRPPIGRLVIVDPCLGVAAGHYLPYARNLTLGAQAMGAEVIWACHARFDEPPPPGVTVRRCFARCFFDLDRENVGGVDLAGELFAGWTQLLDAYDDPRTQFLMHSADAHQLRAVERVFEARPMMRSAVHVNFQTSPRFMPGRIAGAEAHGVVFRLRTSRAWERSLFLWSETRRLGGWLRDWLSEEAPTLPYLTASVGDPAAPDARGDHAFTIAFLGEARPAKGFLDLPDLADAIAAAPGLPATVEMVVQTWRNFGADRPDHQEAVARLRRHPFVEIIDGVLGPDAYERRLALADALLLTYDPAVYALQGSGILIEGFTHGAVILARAGTMMESENEHGVVAVYRTADELVALLAQMAGDRTAIRVRTRTMAARFRKINTPARYVAALDARARGVSPET